MRLLRHRLSTNDLLGVLLSNLADELKTVPGWGYSVQYEDLIECIAGHLTQKNILMSTTVNLTGQY